MSVLVWIIAGFTLPVLAFLCVAWWTQRQAQGSAADYLLADRSFGTWVVGLSTAGASNSGFMFLGAVGAGYTLGVQALWWPVGFFVGDLVFWSLFPARLNSLARERGVYTVPGLLAAQFSGSLGLRVRAVAGSVILVFTSIYLISQFAAGGKVVNALLPVLGNVFGTILTAALIVGYVLRGGIRTSIWTDVVQAVLMIVVAFALLSYLAIEMGGPRSGLSAIIVEQPQLLGLPSERSPPQAIVYVLGFSVAAVGFGLGQPHTLVRLFAGRAPETVRRARWIYIVYSYGLWLSMTVLGMLLAVRMPGEQDAEQTLPHYALEALHPFFAGIVLAGIFSAIASTASAQLLVCSSALATDVSARVRCIGDRHGVLIQYAATVAVGTVAAAFAASVERVSIYSLVLYATVALGCAVAPAVLISVMRWRSTPLSLVASMISGAAVSVAWNALELTEIVSEAVPGLILAIATNAWLSRR